MKPVKVAGALIALVILAGSIVLTLARVVDSESERWVLAASFVPWATIGYAVALVLFLLLARHRRWGRVRTILLACASVSVIGLGLHVWWLAPSYLGEHAKGKPDLVVVESNLLKGLANPGDVAAMLKRENADLVVLTEVTPEK